MEITCYDWDEDTLIDPAGNQVEIYDPEGTLSETVTTGFNKVSDGVVRLIWTVPADADEGWWRAVWTATKGEHTAIKYKDFEVIDKPQSFGGA